MRNHLTGISSPASTFQYDGLGRRKTTVISSTVTSYLHDGLTPVEEIVGKTMTNLLTGLGIDEYFATFSLVKRVRHQRVAE